MKTDDEVKIFFTGKKPAEVRFRCEINEEEDDTTKEIYYKLLLRVIEITLEQVNEVEVIYLGDYYKLEEAQDAWDETRERLKNAIKGVKATMNPKHH
jgi:hypothetical protein